MPLVALPVENINDSSPDDGDLIVRYQQKTREWGKFIELSKSVIHATLEPDGLPFDMSYTAEFCTGSEFALVYGTTSLTREALPYSVISSGSGEQRTLPRGTGLIIDRVFVAISEEEKNECPVELTGIEFDQDSWACVTLPHLTNISRVLQLVRRPEGV